MQTLQIEQRFWHLLSTSKGGSTVSEEFKIGVLGAGMMGAEIALCFARAGYPVIVKDASLELAERGKVRLSGVLDKMISKGKFPPEKKEATLDRIHPTDQYGVLSDVNLVIEAIVEDLDAKKEVFMTLDGICKPDCVFASNTSSIPITRLGANVGSARRGIFLGAHFFSPASVMQLVEVIPGLETSEEAVTFMMDICRKIGKTPVRVKDVTGFVVNRILNAMWIEAMRLLEEGAATAEDIDTACKLGLGHPIGPFALMDLTSNDLNLKVQEILFGAYGERFRPMPDLKQKVYANHLGRKTGRGWFDYQK
jgi:3-hydroxybutyryl-CoA dehydrogenase